MAQRQRKQQPGTEIGDVYTRIESFINRNGKIISAIVGIILVVIIGIFGFQFFYLQPKDKEAQEQMFQAQIYFEQDSFQVALQGDANYPGFLEIIKDYKWTDAANLAHYYAGISFLRTGDYEGAIEFLQDFSTHDQMLKSIKYGAMGDAYMEMGNSGEAINSYVQAAESSPNDLSSPIYLLKAGMAAEKNQKFAQAEEYYKRLRKNYPQTQEGQEAEKHIARVQAKQKS